MRLLVCGSRAWNHSLSVRREIEALAPDHVIHGAAKGADSIAANEAVEWSLREGRGVIVSPYPADWARDGMAAGPIRNSRMLADGKPDRGLAFGDLWKPAARGAIIAKPNHRRTGTGDMVSKMLAFGLPVRWVRAVGERAQDLTNFPDPT